SVVLTPGGAADAARRVGRFAAGRGRSAAAARRPERDGGAAVVSEGLGVLVLGPPREPYLVSGRRLLSIAASTPVVGLRAGDDPGFVGARRGRDRRRPLVAGARDVR